MTKESFIIYKSFYDPIKNLSAQDKSDLLDAIFQFHIDEKITIKLSPMAEISFSFFKNQFRLDNLKYEKIIERNKLNGKKGGRPKKPSGLSGNPKNPKEPKKADNVTVNDNDNEKVKDKGKEEFEIFWGLYPKTNCSKKNAMVAFEKAIKKTDIDTIIISIKKYKEYLVAETWQKPQHQTTWLNGECWHNEYAAYKKETRTERTIREMKEAGKL